MVLATNTATARYVRSLISDNINDCEVGLNFLKRSICESTSSRRVTHRLLHPDVTVHMCYVKGNNVSEQYRVAYSQFRPSGHKLAIESGRWNRRRRGRLSVEEYLCSCGSLQTELHVLEYCPLTDDIRSRHESWRQVMHGQGQFFVPKIVYTVMSRYT